MIKFTKPAILNGSQLIQELKSENIDINEDTSPFIDGNGDFFLDIDVKDVAKATEIVAVHIGIDESVAKTTARQAILARLGITSEEAQLLLGGN
jgi:hypothetical protein